MRNSNKFNLITLAIFSSLAVAFTVMPANAIPGQNINTVIKWAKTRTKLPRLTYSSEAHGYSGTKGNLYFYVDVPSENGIVTKEGITVSGDSSIKFTTKNAKAVKLIQSIYNANIANDFSQSRRITKVGRDHYYRGQKYAYILAEVQGGSAFQIVKLNQLQAEIDSAKYCQTHQCDL
ncbi:hypothetical protein IQ244_25810 [Nostoc sp. LEGE 06077]|uniref:hypothetical protein n=1 Tax=Nostoc sp. LEGE 06077 TaxID=915325 RepID=UPI00187EB808|nr:hypothetical protein [Nostoc sp. LEGE 06077]MBE9209849.1 hypothetical protein [Nostoc sp. LEGE 06077]